MVQPGLVERAPQGLAEYSYDLPDTLGLEDHRLALARGLAKLVPKERNRAAFARDAGSKPQAKHGP